MPGPSFHLSAGLFADVANDWLVHVVEADLRNANVFYVGSYPYDEEAHPLHPDAPSISGVWDGTAPGARQISERQKRYAQYTSITLVEPIYQMLHA